MKIKSKPKGKQKSPLLVMAIEDGWLGNGKDQCVFAAVRLLPSVVKSMRAISRVSHDIGGANILLGYWPVLWDNEVTLDIDKTVWHVDGNRHWAEAYSNTDKLLGRTVALDVRELKMMEGALIWHETDDTDMSVEDAMGRSFMELAWERLEGHGLVKSGAMPPQKKAALRSLLLEMEH